MQMKGKQNSDGRFNASWLIIVNCQNRARKRNHMRLAACDEVEDARYPLAIPVVPVTGTRKVR